jgi:hypothetical protein
MLAGEQRSAGGTRRITLYPHNLSGGREKLYGMVQMKLDNFVVPQRNYDTIRQELRCRAQD